MLARCSTQFSHVAVFIKFDKRPPLRDELSGQVKRFTPLSPRHHAFRNATETSQGALLLEGYLERTWSKCQYA